MPYETVAWHGNPWRYDNYYYYYLKQQTKQGVNIQIYITCNNKLNT